MGSGFFLGEVDSVFGLRVFRFSSFFVGSVRFCFGVVKL